MNRVCDDDTCKGKLIKSGVRYGQVVPEEPMKNGFEHARKADLAIVLGSSMGTSPFCDMPPKAKSMVLCNLSKTSYDSKAKLTFQLPCDEFMHKVVKIMDISLGTYTYTQKYELGYHTIADNTINIFLRGHFKNEPCTCVESVVVKYKGLTKELDQSNITKNFETELRCNSQDNLLVEINYFAAFLCDPLIVDFIIENNDLKVFEFSKSVDYDKL